MKILKAIYQDSSKPLEPLDYSMVAEDSEGNKKQLSWEEWGHLLETVLSENKIEGVQYE